MKGFTLIETIVVILIFSLAMGAIAGLVVMLYRTHSYTREQSLAIDEARKGIEIMVREIRGAETGEDGAYQIWQTENFEFGFYSDVDRDGEAEKVRYFLDGTDFKKGVIEPVGIPATYPTSTESITTITQYVRNLVATSTCTATTTFRYFDKNGDELPPPARKKATKLMEVCLVININPNRPPQNFELKSRVELRNLKKEW